MNRPHVVHDDVVFDPVDPKVAVRVFKRGKRVGP